MAKDTDALEEFEFEFDGIKSYADLGVFITHINWPTGAEITHSAEPVPSRYGSIPLGNAYGAKTWTITAQFMANTNEEYMETVRNITAALTRRPKQGMSFPMRFGTMPEATFYGNFTSLPAATQIQTGVNDARFDLTFTADDPKGYLDQETVNVDSTEFSFTPKGTGEIYPIYRITPKTDMTEVGIAYSSDPTQYVDVGYSESVSETGQVVDNEPVLVNDPCNTLATWKSITDVSEVGFSINGVIDGNVMSNENSISVKRSPNNTDTMYDYGDPLKHTDGKMYGPFLMHQGLPRSVRNFETTFRIRHDKNYSRAISGNEVYGVDSNGGSVFRVYLQDASHGRATEGDIRIGPEGNDISVYKGWKDWHNGTNYSNYVTITKGKTVKTKSTKGSKGKAKTEVVYYTSKKKITNSNNTSYYNQGFIQCRIRKIGLKVWVSLWKCNVANGKTGDYIIKNKVVNLKKDQDFDLATIAWHAKKSNITEDKVNPQTGKVTKKYNYGWNSITSYTVKEILNNGNDAETHPIVHAGETIIIDCERNETTLISGGTVTPLEKRVSIGSTYPSLWGGVTEKIGFSPGVEDAKIEVDYRPTYL